MNAFTFTFRVVASLCIMVVVFWVMDLSFAVGSDPAANATIFGLSLLALWVYTLRAKIKVNDGKTTGAEYSLIILLIGLITLYFPLKTVHGIYYHGASTGHLIQYFKIFFCLIMTIYAVGVLKRIERENRSFVEDFTSFHWMDAVRDLGGGARKFAWTLYAFATSAFLVVSILSGYWLHQKWGILPIIIEVAVVFLITIYFIFLIISFGVKGTKKVVEETKKVVDAGLSKLSRKGEETDKAPSS